ncbi:hypothetical protein BJX96DRAFT_75962 [Aspergillus floccosus]
MSALSIYKGFWIDRDSGTISGATLTLSESQGAVLVSSIAIFVSVVGHYFWTLLCFVLHQFRTVRRPQDGVFHQQQIVLRNTELPSSALYELVMIAFHWRKRAAHTYRRSIPLILTTALMIVGWTTAGVLSPRFLVPARQNVLIDFSECGIYGATGEEARAGREVYTRMARQAQDYSQRCYQETTAFRGGCQTFVTPALRWSGNVSSLCPFREDVCLTGNEVAYRMETQLLDSHVDLGLNALPKDRIYYRRTATCAPLSIDQFTRLDNSSATGQLRLDFYLGEVETVNKGQINLTYSASLEGTEGYVLSGIGTGSPRFIPGINISSPPVFTPIAPLNRADAVVSLAFLSHNGVFYPAPVNDPLFSAHYEYRLTENVTYWYPDLYVTVLGCVMQHQICNARDEDIHRICSQPDRPDLSPEALDKMIIDLGLNPRQAATAILLLFISSTFGIQDVTFGLAAGGLCAQESLAADNGNAALPDHQWIIESQNFFNITLANLQQVLIQYASPPIGMQENWVRMDPDPEYFYRETCGRQKVKATGGHQSFSVLGLAITLFIGALIVVVSLTADSVVGYWQTSRRWGLHRRGWWVIDGKLQLGRLSQEARGFGRWERCVETVPVTRPGDTLGVVAFMENHPIIEYPPPGYYEGDELESLVD